MPVIAIVGAGAGMGKAIARVFGAHDFSVALLSRDPAHLEPIVRELAEQRIDTAAFRADVLDRPSIVSGLAMAKQRFGPIDVLEYSPSGVVAPLAAATDVTYENLQVWLEFLVHGAMAAVNAVLPDMLARGSGTILFTTGASSVYPAPMFGNVGPAAACLRNWAHALHHAVAPKGVQVGHVAIGAFLGRQPGATPDAVAPLYWELHTERDQCEKTFIPEAVPWLPGSVARPIRSSASGPSV
jgi:NAD(P)-dependent dehydrogenase (short-subunit alcohol dehydrogenase family)